MSENERKYVIILGAMKSGTSAIFSLLAQHPQICPSEPKEPQFFVRKDYNNTKIDEYDSYWDCRDSGDIKYYLEASTSYTKIPTFPNAAERIKESGIPAKFIYIMRHPLERLISQLNMALSMDWVSYNRDQMVHDILINNSRYHFQIKEYYDRFEKEDILLLCFEDFATNPGNTIDTICRFLDISPGFNFNFKKTRRHDGTIYMYKHKSLLKKIRLNLNRYKIKARKYPPLEKMLGSLEQGFDKSFGKKQVRLSKEDEARITAILKEDLKLLQDRYGFDISKWDLTFDIKMQT